MKWIVVTVFFFAVVTNGMTQQVQPAATQDSGQQANKPIQIIGGKGPYLRMLTVKSIAADHFIAMSGTNSYTVEFNASTQFRRGNIPIGPPDIKVNDDIMVVSATYSEGTIVAQSISQAEPGSVMKSGPMDEFDKTWLAGKIIIVDGEQLTIKGLTDHQTYTLVTESNTLFFRGINKAALTDFKVGDWLRADGVIRDGKFVAAVVKGFAIAQPPAQK